MGAPARPPGQTTTAGGQWSTMSEAGLVVARFRRHALIESGGGERCLCQLQRRGLRPVVGDAVRWRRESDGTGTLEEVEPRTSELKRIDSRGRPEIAAANLSQLIVVLAESPAPDWFLLDRYLCAGELAGLGNTIVYNKVDLAESLPSALDDYADLGYRVSAVSAHDKTGLESLEKAIRGRRSALIGQSGVGKSSLINALMGDALQKVGELSDKVGLGRHTTTTAVLHRLPGGGEIIDSPGVRDFAPFIADTRDVQRGFREIVARSSQCRFDDCKHFAEPDCAVKAALAGGEIGAHRFESYKRLYELTESFQSR